MNRRLFCLAAVLALTLPLGPGSIFPLGPSASNGNGSTFTASCSQSATFLARAGAMTLVYEQSYDALICGLVTAGIWSTLDYLYVFSGPSQAVDVLNLVSTGFTITPHGSGTFSAFGYTGDGSTGYLDTGYTPSTSAVNCTLNSCEFAIYDNTSRTDTLDGCGGQAGSRGTNNGNTLFQIICSPATSYNYINNGNSGDASTTPTNAQGFWNSIRTASNAFTVYYNGLSEYNSGTASTALPNESMIIGAFNDSGTIDSFSTDTITFASTGAKLTAPQALQFYQLLLAFLQPIPTATFVVQGVAASALPKWVVNYHSFLALTTPTQALTLMQQIGAQGVRDQLSWANTEQVSNTYVWTNDGNQASWNAFCGAGLYADMVATYNNTLYSSANFSIINSGANTTAYGNYAVAMANNFIGTCPNMAEELFNEPNFTNSTGGAQWLGGPYAVMAETAATAIKGAHSAVTTFTGGITPGSQAPATFAAAMTAGATMTNLNQEAIHPYNYNNVTPSSTLTPHQLAVDVAAIATAFGAQLKPLPITEDGYPLNAITGTCGSAANVNLQGIFYGWMMLEAAYIQSPMLAAYELMNEGIQCSGDTSSYGMFLTPADSPPSGIKPAGTAFKNVTACFSGAVTYDIATYPPYNVFEIIVHKTGTSRCRAIWFAVAGDTIGTLSAAVVPYTENMGTFSTASATDLLGNSVALSVSGSNVTVVPKLSETSGPVLVTTN